MIDTTVVTAGTITILAYMNKYNEKGKHVTTDSVDDDERERIHDVPK